MEASRQKIERGLAGREVFHQPAVNLEDIEAPSGYAQLVGVVVSPENQRQSKSSIADLVREDRNYGLFCKTVK